MTKQWVQYHKDEPGNSISSLPGKFEAWANVRPRQPNWKPPVQVGDRVWLLSGKAVGSGKKTYSFVYSFIVSEPAQRVGDRYVLRGVDGLFFEGGGALEQLPWFKEFFDSIGSGGISFQAIQPQYLSHLEHLVSAPKGADTLDEVMADAPDDEESEERRYLRSILARRGQSEFRERLIEAYGGRCCVTNCQILDVLEAAHIDPHSEGGGYHTSNGLLLRADIHTLFDLYLIGIDEGYKIYVTKSLRSSEYGKFHGHRIYVPDSLSEQPRSFGLGQRLAKLKRQESVR